MKKAVLLSVLLLAIPVLTHANEANKRVWSLMPEKGGIAHISYAYNHKSDLKDSATNGRVGIQAVDVAAQVPIPITENFFIAPGAQYYLHHFMFDNITDYVDSSSINAHIITINLDAILTLNENWLLDVNFAPTISSDLKSMGRHDFQFPGRVLAVWAFNDIASMLFGVQLSKEFWTYLPTPILGFIVRPKNSFFKLEAILPAYVRMDFRVASFIELFTMAEFEGFVWNVHADSKVPDHFMKMYDTHVGAGANFRVYKGIHVEAWGGVNPYRKYHYTNMARVEGNVRQKLGYFAKATVVITSKLFQ